jgi:hypothetical protein
MPLQPWSHRKATSMNATINPADANAAVFALLTVVADPAAHKARLDELIAQESATGEQIAALNAMAADTRRLHSAAEAQNIVSNNRKTALDAREAELDTRAQALMPANLNPWRPAISLITPCRVGSFRAGRHGAPRGRTKLAAHRESSVSCPRSSPRNSSAVRLPRK